MFFFFFNDTATTEIYTLSLHDALPICLELPCLREQGAGSRERFFPGYFGLRLSTLSPGRRRLSCSLLPAPCSQHRERIDRKSTRLNSSHSQISYAVFCLKKKKQMPLAAITVMIPIV